MTSPTRQFDSQVGPPLLLSRPPAVEQQHACSSVSPVTRRPFFITGLHLSPSHSLDATPFPRAAASHSDHSDHVEQSGQEGSPRSSQGCPSRRETYMGGELSVCGCASERRVSMVAQRFLWLQADLADASRYRPKRIRPSSTRWTRRITVLSFEADSRRTTSSRRTTVSAGTPIMERITGIVARRRKKRTRRSEVSVHCIAGGQSSGDASSWLRVRALRACD